MRMITQDAQKTAGIGTIIIFSARTDCKIFLQKPLPPFREHKTKMLHMGVFSRLTRRGGVCYNSREFRDQGLTEVWKFAHDNKRKHEERRI